MIRWIFLFLRLVVLWKQVLDLFYGSILIKLFVFESFINVLLSMLMISFIKDGSSQILHLLRNLSLVCTLITFPLHDHDTIPSGVYKTKTVFKLKNQLILLIPLSLNEGWQRKAKETLHQPSQSWSI